MNPGKLLTFLLLGMIALGVLSIVSPMTIVGAGERGVVTRWGALQDRTLTPGIHWVAPIADSVTKIDVQTQKLDTETLAYSKDIQTVTVKLALNYHVKPEVVGRMYQDVGKDFQSRLIDPTIQESVKSATAKFTAQELIEQRPRVKDEIKNELFTRTNNYFVVDEFSITDFSFSDQYEAAVEAKQVAQQKAFEQENVTKQVEEKAKQRVAEATAEAQAIKIQAEAVTQQGGADYVQLKAIERWNGQLPAQMIPGSTVPFVNLTK